MTNETALPYSELKELADRGKIRFFERCDELGVRPIDVFKAFQPQIIARIVRESSLQEGYDLSMPRTIELTDEVLQHCSIPGPHLDLTALLGAHRLLSLHKKHNGASVEEVATFNLAFAMTCVIHIADELQTKHAASLVQLLRDTKQHMDAAGTPLPEKALHVFTLIEDILTSPEPAHGPLTHDQPVTTVGELTTELLKLDPVHLSSPMSPDYLHFLHSVVTMGLLAPSKRGRWRTNNVSISGSPLLFPPPALVPGLMVEFCRNFPMILPNTVSYDPILEAAKASHSFVRIHPYPDGNGRLSRLIMNLVLFGHHFTVPIKADEIGRHRYLQALRAADQDNYEPLASVIARELAQQYQEITDSIRPR